MSSHQALRNNSYKRLHTKTRDAQERKSHICPVCSSRFRTDELYKLHYKEHHSIKPSVIQ